MQDKIYRRPDVESLVGLSRSTIYAIIADGTFPKPIKLGKRAVGYASASLSKTERAARCLVAMIREHGWQRFTSREVMRMD